MKKDSTEDKKAKSGDIFTLANIITFLGIIAAALSFYFFYVGDYKLSFWFLVGAVASDFLDGHAARKYTESKLGEKMDPIRDKLLILVFLLFHWTIIFSVIAEIFCFIYSIRVRRIILDKYKESHFVAKGSKIATAVQFMTGITLFLTKIYLQENPFYLLIFGVCIITIITCSISRILVYRNLHFHLTE